MGLKDRLFNKRNELFGTVTKTKGVELASMDEELSIGYLVRLSKENYTETINQLKSSILSLGIDVHILQEQIDDQLKEYGDDMLIDIYCTIRLEDL